MNFVNKREELELFALRQAIQEYEAEEYNAKSLHKYNSQQPRVRSELTKEAITKYMAWLWSEKGEPKKRWKQLAAAHFKVTVRTINRKLQEK